MKRFLLLFLILVLFTRTAAAENAVVFKADFRSGDYRYTLLADGTVCVEGYFGEAAELTIPAELDGKPVTAIGNEAFYNSDSLTAITIPDSVTAIGDNAFYDCESLTEITIPNSVREVGANPFEHTPAAIRVSPEHPCLAVIDGVLLDKERQRLISYPYGSGLSEYAIPQGIQQIGDRAFYDCTSLTAVTIPDSVTAIGKKAFSGCSSLTAITIPDSVISIGDFAFMGCYSLTEITIPDSTISIGDGAFSSCSGLTEISIPDSVREVGANPFRAVPAALRVSPEHPYFAVIDGVLFDKECQRLISYPHGSELSEYVIPQGVRQIGDSAFVWCYNLKEITIPDSVTAIENLAFSKCESLTAITIPDSVTAIGDKAFNRCNRLTAITIPDSVTAIGADAFSWCESLTLTVRRDSYAAQYCKDNDLLYQYPNVLDWLNGLGEWIGNFYISKTEVNHDGTNHTK